MICNGRTKCPSGVAGVSLHWQVRLCPPPTPFPPTPAHFTYHLFHLGVSPSFSGVAWCDPSKSAPALLLRSRRVAPPKSSVAAAAAAVTSRQGRRRLNGDFSEANEMQRNWVASEYVGTWALFCWDTGISSAWTCMPPPPPVFDLARLFVKWSASDGELEEKFNLAVMSVLHTAFFFSRCLSRSAVPSVTSERRFCVSVFLKISFSDES